jgi:hypothetical protein
VLEDDAALLVAVVVVAAAAAVAAVAKSEKVEVRVVIRVCIFFWLFLSGRVIQFLLRKRKYSSFRTLLNKHLFIP